MMSEYVCRNDGYGEEGKDDRNHIFLGYGEGEGETGYESRISRCTVSP